MIDEEDIEGGTALLRNPSTPAPSSGPLEITSSDHYSPSKNKISNAYLARHTTESLRMYGLILAAVTCFVAPFLPIECKHETNTEFLLTSIALLTNPIFLALLLQGLFSPWYTARVVSVLLPHFGSVAVFFSAMTGLQK